MWEQWVIYNVLHSLCYNSECEKTVLGVWMVGSLLMLLWEIVVIFKQILEEGSKAMGD